MLITTAIGSEIKEQYVLSPRLGKEFEIKVLGRLKYFLGIEVANSKRGIFISKKTCLTSTSRY